MKVTTTQAVATVLGLVEVVWRSVLQWRQVVGGTFLGALPRDDFSFFEDCQRRLPGHGFITDYAGTHPVEYFAESMTAISIRNGVPPFASDFRNMANWLMLRPNAVKSALWPSCMKDPKK